MLLEQSCRTSKSITYLFTIKFHNNVMENHALNDADCMI